MNFHQTFEILDSPHSQLVGGRLVTQKDGGGVLLECGNGPHVVDAFFDGLVKCKSLVSTSDQDHHLEKHTDHGGMSE